MAPDNEKTGRVQIVRVYGLAHIDNFCKKFEVFNDKKSFAAIGISEDCKVACISRHDGVVFNCYTIGARELQHVHTLNRNKIFSDPVVVTSMCVSCWPGEEDWYYCAIGTLKNSVHFFGFTAKPSYFKKNQYWDKIDVDQKDNERKVVSIKNNKLLVVSGDSCLHSAVYENSKLVNRTTY